MCFAATCPGNAAPEDFRDDLSRIARAVHSKVSKPIRRKTLRVERAKARLIAKEWTASHGHATREKKFDGRIEPQDWDPGIAKEFGAAGLCVSAAAEREDSGFLKFGSTAESGTQLIRFDLAKRRFAEALENLRDGQAGGLLDALIQVDETPRQLPRQESAHGRFAGTHKTGKADYLRA
jgi:hypothetical protein